MLGEMKPWERSKLFSDQFLPEIKAIVGAHLISEAPVEDDQCKNTDLIVLKLDAIRIACRVRSSSYMKYAGEFTIRSSRPSGTKTELRKIIEGWGDYLLYGITDDSARALGVWHLADLSVFRAWFCEYSIRNRGSAAGVEMRNGDKSSAFRVFRWDDLPAEFVVASGGTSLGFLS